MNAPPVADITGEGTCDISLATSDDGFTSDYHFVARG
jgi:hypothetical protein